MPPDPGLVLHADPRRLRLPAVVRYVLRVRTNVLLITASACAYYFLAGMEIFGTEFAESQYRVGQAVANLLLLTVGAGAIAGVISSGTAGDALLRRRHLRGRILVGALAAAVAVVAFVPVLLTHDLFTALPYLAGAAFFLAAQNPRPPRAKPTLRLSAPIQAFPVAAHSRYCVLFASIYASNNTQ